jgi:hypothetical protein
MISRRMAGILAAAMVTAAVGPFRQNASGEENADAEFAITAQFAPAEGDAPARLYITAEIGEGWHVFSVTQPKGGPLATKITLAASSQFKVLEKSFTASPPPETRYSDVFPGLPLEEHEHRVVWHVPIELADGVDPADVKIEGKLRAQRCNKENCLPPKTIAFTALVGEGVELGDPEGPAE